MMSSTKGTSPKRSATERRAATTILASGNRRRRSAIAGRAMTASPSQFGARTARHRGSDIGLCIGAIVQDIGDVRGLGLAPPAMHPEPQVRVTPHVHLQ